MKLNRHLYVVPFFLCGSLLAGEAAASKTAAARSRENSVPAKAASVAASDIPPGAKVVLVGERDVVSVKSKIRFSTLIILPKNEQILDITCGDKEYWIVNGSQNFVSVKPAKAGSQTNMNLITASGNVYSFALSEVSETGEPDLKVFVEPKDDSMIASSIGAPKLFSAKQVDDCRQEIQKAQEETQKAKEDAQTAIDSGIAKFMANVRFPYRFEAGKKPFFVRAMYHNEKFTFIQARPEEAPALYELKDGKPNLVNFAYRNGVYVVEKVLDRGYLVIGKQKLAFAREE